MDDLIAAADGIHKTYDTGAVRVHALRGVDLNIRRGEMVAIMGPSGCGKTTLLNCLSGLDDLDSGQVLIDGVVLTSCLTTSEAIIALAAWASSFSYITSFRSSTPWRTWRCPFWSEG